MSDADSFANLIDQHAQVPEGVTMHFVGMPAVPERIGRYRVETILGHGGYGRVYLAIDEQLNRKVAIKVPRSDLVSNPESVKFFLDEARNVASLDHPHIVPVYDVGGTPDFPSFIVAKFIEGCDLARRIRSTVLTHPQIVKLVASVAEALHYAHGRGLVHRDVKPANILVDNDGLPYVVDFGLALREEALGSGAGYCGTPAYMSPEQARGEGHRVDARSDIFSLGVVLYEMLAGYPPFQAETKLKLMMQVTHLNPVGPSASDPSVPQELDRICLKALAKRVNERYATAAEMARDLRQFLAAQERGTTAKTPPKVDVQADTSRGRVHSTLHLSPPQALHIVPKGLRSYDMHDADFFMGLLPGPRDREGVPEALRFWKVRIEESDPQATFSVGVIYGPSGCGKSSLVKAGLLPLLSNDVTAIYVEATAEAMETRLERALRRRFPFLKSQLGLTDILAGMRRGDWLPVGKKVVLVLDQFEQWLQATPELETSELVPALRQCDGGNLQCVVLVRDDFWLALSRFMQAIEIPVLEGGNAKLVDLFDQEHAIKVLAAFSEAFGKVPTPAGALANYRQFLEEAIQGMAQDGKVVCVRLALFAEMMKSKPWTPATLKTLGGTEGIGFSFLEETFAASTAPAQHRRHRAAAQAVLKSLLPPAAMDIKGHIRSRSELLKVSGYANRERDFDELVRVLDTELRLITPADPTDFDINPANAPPRNSQYFQLTHDYLVRSLREWLTRKEKETRRGRAELLLEDRSTVWNARRENRQLPGPIQWLQIRRLTKSARWTEPQANMMRVATRYHGLRAITVVLAVATLCLVGFEARGRFQAHALNQRLLDADTQEVAAIVQDMTPYRRWLDPLLKDSLAAASQKQDSRQELHARLALLPADGSLATPVFRQMLTVEPKDVLVIRDALLPHKAQFTDQLWAMVESGREEGAERLRAATTLARFDPENDRWKHTGETLVHDLVNVPPAFLQAWAEGLQPVRRDLVPQLAGVYRDAKRSESERTMAASVLAEYTTDEPGVATELLLDADERNFLLFYPLVAKLKDRTVRLLESSLHGQPVAKWNDAPLNPNWKEPDAPTRQQIEAASGVISPRFAFCQRMPLSTFLSTADHLKGSGYRPVRFRPYGTPMGIKVAAVWTRDGLVWDIAHGLDKQAIIKRFEEMQDKNFAIEDLVGYREEKLKFGAVWVARSPAHEDTRIMLALSEKDLASKYELLWNWHYFPVTAQVALDDAGRRVISQVCRYAPPLYWNQKVDVPESALTELMAAGYPLVDASVDPRTTPEPHFSAVGQMDLSFTSVAVCSKDEATHLKQCQALIAQGYRPASISVDLDKANHAAIVSVWQRPLVVDEMKVQSAKRRANAAAALLKMNRGDAAWPTLKTDAEPTTRSFLIRRLARYGVSASLLYRRLIDETDPSIRQALILSLGEYSSEQWKPEAEHVQFLRLMYLTAAEPGLRAAAEWVLRRWNEDAWLTKSQAEQARQSKERLAEVKSALHETNAKTRWYVNGQQQTMVAIPGPLEFDMGLSIADTLYFATRDTTSAYWTEHDRLHPCRVNRTFAIAAKPVTVEQFSRFNAAHQQTPGFAPTPDCPAISISWHEAAAYCNWLSKQEGIPKDEWCYLVSSDGQVSQRRPNYLRKTGYRLPTEAEMEVATRAGTTTSFSFGGAKELLPDYGWYLPNSSNRTWPVGLKKPNDWGLFDIHGEVICFCDGAYAPFPWKNLKRPIEDVEEVDLTIKPTQRRAAHGASFRAELPSTYSGSRWGLVPTDRESLAVGIRPARTLH